MSKHSLDIISRRWAYDLGRLCREQRSARQVCVFRPGTAHERWWLAGWSGVAFDTGEVA